MKRIIHAALVFICCLLLTACGQKSSKWLPWEVDQKTEIGRRHDSVETFAECIQQRQVLSATKLRKLFDREADIVRKNRATADWGNLACLAFNDLATVYHVKEAALLLPDENISSEEEMMVGPLRTLLNKRAVTLGKLSNLEQLLTNSLDLLNQLQSQVERLQEIEELLEKK